MYVLDFHPAVRHQYLRPRPLASQTLAGFECPGCAPTAGVKRDAGSKASSYWTLRHILQFTTTDETTLLHVKHGWTGIHAHSCRSCQTDMTGISFAKSKMQMKLCRRLWLEVLPLQRTWSTRCCVPGGKSSLAKVQVFSKVDSNLHTLAECQGLRLSISWHMNAYAS